jgi:hypothetical protein
MTLKLSDFNEGEIKEIEAPKKTGGGLLNYLKGIPVGVAKTAGEVALGAGQIGRKIQGAVGNITGINSTGGMGGTSPFDPQEAQRIRETTLAANSPGQGTGTFIGTALQFLAPTSGVTKGQQILGAAASQLPKFGGAQLAGKAAARFLPEAIGTGAVSAIRSGGDLEQAKQEGTLAGGFSVGLGALGGLAKSTYWPMLDDSVNKALGVQGKKSGGVALKQTAQKTAGLQVLKDRAKDLTVTAEDGLKTVFDPQNASYNTTLQAWKQAREKVFNEYTEMASKAGEKANVDLSSIRQQMVNALDGPFVEKEINAVKSLLNDFDRVFTDPSNVDMQMAEKFVQSLNKNTVSGFFKGTSEAASSEVNAGTSKLIRDIMDDVIEESTGAQYQATRSQYAALKSLEDDLVRKFQQDARSIGGGLPEYTGAFASGDIIGSALSLDPAQFAKGATLGTFSVLKRKLSNPERFLRRSFDLIDDVPSDLSLRIWGGSKPLNAGEEKLAGDIAESIKNPSVGLSTKPVGIPKGTTDADLITMRDYTDMVNGAFKPTAAEAKALSDQMDEVAKRLKLKNAFGGEKALSNEAAKILDEAQFSETLPSFNQGATPKLADEAKKYKSADEFVSKGEIMGVTDASKYYSSEINKITSEALKDKSPKVRDYFTRDFMGDSVEKNLQQLKKQNIISPEKYSEITSLQREYKKVIAGLENRKGSNPIILDESKMSQIRESISDVLTKKYGKPYKSDSGSKYFKTKDGETIRLSNHAIPDTESRAYYNSMYGDKFKEDIIIPDEIIRKVEAKNITENYSHLLDEKTKSQLTDIWNKANGK